MRSTKQTFWPHAQNSIANTESIWTRLQNAGSRCSPPALWSPSDRAIGSLFVVDTKTEPRSTLSPPAAIQFTSMGYGKRSKSTLIGRSTGCDNLDLYTQGRISSYCGGSAHNREAAQPTAPTRSRVTSRSPSCEARAGPDSGGGGGGGGGEDQRLAQLPEQSCSPKKPPQ